MSEQENWREKEPSLKEVIANNPEVPPLMLLKADVCRRGITYTKAALDLVDSNIHQTEIKYLFREDKGNVPVALSLRDGSSLIVFLATNAETGRDPYVVDALDGIPYIFDNGEPIEEVHYWTKPDYYSQKTSRGTEMWKVVNARPQRLDIDTNDCCHFWDKPGGGCKYCFAAGAYNDAKNLPKCRLNLDDLRETVGAALKQKGRFSTIMLTGGSILSGKEVLDDEVDMYIEVLQAVGANFKTRRFPSQLVATAFNERQLERLHEKTGLMGYTPDIEVLNAEKFKWICPGKEEFVGYHEWKRRLYHAVDIFGKGNVNTGIVGGVETATPYGFKTEEEALRFTLEEAEELAEHGVSCAASIWQASPGSVFRNQKTPTLDYFAKLMHGLDEIRRKYDIPPFLDDYKRCGSHPNTDLGRM